MNKLFIFIAGIILGLTNLAGAVTVGSYVKFADMAENTSNVGWGGFYIWHVEDCLETQDLRDVLWENFPDNPNPYWLRLSSNPWGKELAHDFRPLNSISPVEVSFAVMITQSPSDYVVCDNYLWVREITARYQPVAFSGKPITFQQKSLTGDPGEIYPVFDLRRAYALNGGRVTLYDPNGAPHKLNKVYYNGETDLKGVIRFDRYLSDINDDKVVDIKDLALLVGNWMQEGFAIVGDLSGEFGIPDGRVDLFDLAVMAEEWGVRYVAP